MDRKEEMMEKLLSAVKPHQLAIIQWGVLKLVNSMITYQGLEKTLEDIRSALPTPKHEVPQAKTELAWKSMLSTVKTLIEALEEFNEASDQEKKDNEK